MITRILSPTLKSISQAARVLRRDGVVGMPTETVYGLAGAAFREEALLRIFSVKERPVFDPLILHLAPQPGASALDQLKALRLMDPASLSQKALDLVDRLTQKLWPGALTLVLPKGSAVPDLATSGLNTVAVRMPRHPVAQALIREAKMPLAAPSANRFGRISPTTARHVFKELGGRIELILDGGPCEIGLESTIVAVNPSGSLTLLRPGGIALNEIKKLAGKKIQLAGKTSGTKAQPAPGMLASHYAPVKPLTVLPAPVQKLKSNAMQLNHRVKTLGLLVFGSAEPARKRLAEITGRKVFCRSLTETGNLKEAAKCLFTALRQVDESKAEVLFSEPCRSEAGIGFAIADRLRRASHPHRTPAIKGISRTAKRKPAKKTKSRRNP